jgi:hypothetical protein
MIKLRVMHANRNHAGWENKTSPVEETKLFLGSRWGNKSLKSLPNTYATLLDTGPGRHCGVAILVFLCVIVCFISLKTPCDFCLHSLNSYGNLKARWKAKKSKTWNKLCRMYKEVYIKDICICKRILISKF